MAPTYTIVIVECDVVFEDVGGRFHRHDVVDDEFAKSGQVISPFVELLNFRVIVHIFILLFNEDVVLDEVVDQLNHGTISLMRQKSS